MKKLLLSLICLTAVVFAGAQAQYNDPNVEKRSVGSFHGIDVATGVELVLMEGVSEEVAVSAATAEFRDRIVTKVENGILKIHYETKTGAINRRKETKHLKAWVSYKMLDKLVVSTGAEVKVNGVLKAATLRLDATTGGLVNAAVDIEDLTVSQSTGSKITLTGKASKLKVNGDTGSKFTADEMTTNQCSVKVDTGARAVVRAEQSLEVKANTGGIVQYKGNASNREFKTFTGGRVQKI